MVTRFRELVNIHMSIKVLDREKVLRAYSTGVALLVSAVGLVDVSQQGALVAEGLVAVDALEGGAQTSILRRRAFWVALGNMSLEVFWDVKTLLATAAFARFLQFPFVGSRKARSATVFAPLVYLHVAMEGTGGEESSPAHGALVGFVRGVRFHVDFEVITAGEGRVTLSTMVLLVAGVELDVSVAAALVLKQAAAEGAAERELVPVALLVALEEAQAAEGLVTKLTRVRQAGAPFLFPEIIVLAVSRRSLILTGGRRSWPRTRWVILKISTIWRGRQRRKQRDASRASQGSKDGGANICRNICMSSISKHQVRWSWWHLSKRF